MADSKVLGGERDEIAAFVVPLGSDLRAHRWQVTRLNSLLQLDSPRTYLSLFVVHTGAPTSSVLVDDVALQLDVGGERVTNAPFPHFDALPLAGTSTLVHRTIERYRGQALHGGESFEVLVSFLGDVAIEQVRGGSLTFAGTTIELSPSEMTRTQLERMGGETTRTSIEEIVGLKRTHDEEKKR